MLLPVSYTHLVGLRIGFHRYRGGKSPRMRRHLRRAAEAGILDDADLLMADEGGEEAVSYTHLDVYKRQGIRPVLL